MTVSGFLRLYRVALPAFLAIDLVWLGWLAKPFYRDQLGHLMRPQVDWVAAIAFYLLFVAGIVILAVRPALERRSRAHAVRLGALLGLVTYAAYDLTNLAVLEGFPVVLALVDMAWGTVLCAGVSVITYTICSGALRSGQGEGV